MKIVVTDPTAAETQAKNLGILEEQLMDDLMVRAYQHLPGDKTFTLITGPGNNGADAYTLGCLLLQHNRPVLALPLFKPKSPLCIKKQKLFVHLGGKLLDHVDQIPADHTLIDGIFGHNYTPRASSSIPSFSSHEIFALDLPTPPLQASVTLCLACAKLPLYTHNNRNNTGTILYIDSPLLPPQPTSYQLLERHDLCAYLPKISATDHKYRAGHVFIAGGSPGMSGACQLAALGAFRTGAGIVHLLTHPDHVGPNHSMPELITLPFSPRLPKHNPQKTSLVLGPALGLDQHLLVCALVKHPIPQVLDADALTILSQHPLDLAPHTLLTPHLGEMNRLLHTQTSQVTPDYLTLCQQYAADHRVTILLKGAPTFVIPPTPPITLVDFGTPALATAGSGDLLSGMLGALIIHMSPLHAALLGSSIHALSGSLAAQSLATPSLLASDIAHHIPHVLQDLKSETPLFGCCHPI